MIRLSTNTHSCYSRPTRLQALEMNAPVYIIGNKHESTLNTNNTICGDFWGKGSSGNT